MQLQVVLDGLGRVEHLALAQLLGQGAACQFQHGHQFCALGRPQAPLMRARSPALVCSSPAMPPKPPVERPVVGLAWRAPAALAPLQHAFAHDAGAQQHGQQLGIGQRGGPRARAFRAAARRPGRSFSGMAEVGRGRNVKCASLSRHPWQQFNRVLS